MRAARNTYALAVRAAVVDAGFDDVPRDGVFALAAMGEADFSPAQLSGLLNVSKQAVSQLVDTLVVRGYVERALHAADRRRMQLSLTERGKSVVAASRGAVEALDRRVARAVGAAHVEHTRQTLAAIADLAAERRRGPSSSR